MKTLQCSLAGLPLVSLPKAYVFQWQSEYSWDNIPGLTRWPLRRGLLFALHGEIVGGFHSETRAETWDYRGIFLNPCLFMKGMAHIRILCSVLGRDIWALFNSFILWINTTNIEVLFWILVQYTEKASMGKLFHIDLFFIIPIPIGFRTCPHTIWGNPVDYNYYSYSNPHRVDFMASDALQWKCFIAQDCYDKMHIYVSINPYK